MPLVERSAPSRMARMQAVARRQTVSTKLLWVPLLALAFNAILSPLVDSLTTADYTTLFAQADAGRLENKIFWVLLAAFPIFLTLRNPRRVFSKSLPPTLIALFLFLLFAGLSVTWAFNPAISFRRYAQQIMLISTLVIPMILAPRSIDLMYRVYVLLAVAAILNLFFVFAGLQTVANKIYIGYQGYFTHKNLLGEFAAFCMFLAAYELTRGGTRRLFGAFILALSTYLLFKANSKTSLALAFVMPVFAILLLGVGRLVRVSPTTVLFTIVSIAVAGCVVTGITIYDISEKLYGDRTFTVRTEIWDFVNYEIARYRNFGWGFQSFWLVGPDGPSITDAPGWVKNMPQAHNGYLDIWVTTGRIGLGLFIPYLIFTLVAIGRLAETEFARAWLYLSLAMFIIVANFLETTWLEGQSFHWPIFVLMSADAALRARDLPSKATARSNSNARTRQPGPARPQVPRTPADYRGRSRMPVARFAPSRRR